MSAYRKFDPYAVILGSGGAPPKVAKVAKVDPANPKTDATLGALGTLGGLAPDNVNPSARSLAAATPRLEVNPLGAEASPSAHAPGIVPVGWLAGLQRLNAMTCPISVEPNRWSQLQGDANRFVATWGRQATALGWSALDVFGCHPASPSGRYDCMGVVWMVASSEVRAMSTELVIFRKSSGSLKRAWKSPATYERILVWDL
jgi:hypothetical protein